MKVSVIIPTLNRAEFLSKAIDSVIAQTWQDWEMIVIDDGSTDDTSKLLKSYEDRDSRVRSVKGPGKGAAAARNAGMKEITGELIAFLDDDDYWADNKLELQVGLHRSYPDLGLSFTDGYVVRPDGSIVRELLAQENPAFKDWIESYQVSEMAASVGDIYPLLIRDCLMGTSCVVIPAEILKTVGYFNEKYRVGEDYDYWLRILESRRAGIVMEKLTFYQVTDDGLSGSEEKRAFVWHDGISFMLEDRLRETPEEYRGVLTEVLCRRAEKAAWFFKSRGDYKKTRDLSLLILRQKPWRVKYWLYYGLAALKG